MERQSFGPWSSDGGLVALLIALFFVGPFVVAMLFR